MRYSRRDFGKLALAGIPRAAAWKTFGGHHRSSPPSQNQFKDWRRHDRRHHLQLPHHPGPAGIIKAYQTIGLGEMELMSNTPKALAGIPRRPGGGGGGGRRGGLRRHRTDCRRATRPQGVTDWRKSASEATFKPVRKLIEDAGIELRLLCYNMSDLRTQADGRTTGTTDEGIEYGFMMAKWLGLDTMSTSTQVSMAKRIAPFADKHKIMVGFHGHANTKDTNEVASPETFDAVMAASKYHGANLDIGHYTEAGYDPVAFIQKHHARSQHSPKDKKRRAAHNGPWGTGRYADQGSLN